MISPIFSTLLLGAALLMPIPKAAAQTGQTHPCYPLEYIYARGTTEPGPLGFILGRQLKAEIEDRLGSNVLFLGLNYPASFNTPTSQNKGITNLVARVNARATACPSMKFALAGYSQGADVVHNALQQLSAHKDRIIAITMFGDQLASVGFPAVYEGRVASYCHDRGCGGTGVGTHVLYGFTPVHVAAADFVEDLYNGPLPTPTATASTLTSLPPVGAATGFYDTNNPWPPAAWATDFTDGYSPDPELFDTCLTVGLTNCDGCTA